MKDKNRSSITGLPAELGIDEELGKQRDRVTVERVTRRYGKPVTLVTGFESGTVDLVALASELKRALATGGSVKDQRIEVQGDHVDAVTALLAQRGFEVVNA